ncbi:hypothetical protein FGIG_08564 [Fasciola gigantica]|uniref:Uncharacterized protein n=1 Tax=Fasciola gigantica TaxID=46835 RepID=A0A504YET4_FASGI|nr:hypothetical protein FGIG_08564 [Fasciola gigantica]
MQELPSGSHTSDKVYLLQTSLSSQPENVATSNFRQRQTDVFACLAGLEAAHKEVTKATRDERKVVQKAAWRRPHTAPEDLVAEKERRDTKQTSCSQELATHRPSSEFRRPAAIPRPRAHSRAPRTVQRDPSKWTHYSLADVDEDGFAVVATEDGFTNRRDPNVSIALSLLSELRERRVTESQTADKQLDEEGANFDGPVEGRRILFRPTRGTKRVRLQDNETNESKIAPVAIAVSDLIQDEEDQVTQVTHGDCSPDKPDSYTFIARRQRGRFSGRQLASADEDLNEMDERRKSDGIGEDHTEASDTTDNEVELEGGIDEEEDEVVDNNFLA